MSFIDSTKSFFHDLFGNRYEASPDDLYTAMKTLENATTRIEDIITSNSNGISMITNSLGYYNREFNLENLNTYATIIKENIGDLSLTLEKQADMIEKYNSSSTLTRIFNSYLMMNDQTYLGFLSVFEDLFDAGTVLLINAGSALGFDTTAMQLFAARDLVGELQENLYKEGGLFHNLEIYSNFSNESTAANVFKDFGSASAYIALALIPGGAIVEATIAGTAGYGKASTSYMRSHVTYDETGERKFDDSYSLEEANKAGVRQGVTDAALTFAMSKAFDAVLGTAKNIGKVADDATDLIPQLSGELETSAKNGIKTVSKGTEDVAMTVVKDTEKTVGKDLISTTEKVTGKEISSTAGNVTKREATAAAENVTKKEATSATEKISEQAKRTGIFDKPYEYGNKKYTKLEDVWEDFKKGEISSKEANKIVDEAIGKEDSSLAHEFMADVSNAKKGKNFDMKWQETAEKARSEMNATSTTPSNVGVGEPLPKQNISTAKPTSLQNVSQTPAIASTANQASASVASTAAKKSSRAAYKVAAATVGAEEINQINQGAHNSSMPQKPLETISGPAGDGTLIGSDEYDNRPTVNNLDDETVVTDINTDPTIETIPDVLDNNQQDGNTNVGTNIPKDENQNTTTVSPPTETVNNTNTETNFPNYGTQEVGPQENNTTITNQESSSSQTTSSSNGSSGMSHGGSSSNNNYNFVNSGISTSQDGPIEILTDEKPGEDQITSLPDDDEDIYTIPTDLSGAKNTKKGFNNSAIPIFGGLGAAAAVGVGAKMYMDHKKNNDNDENSDINEDNREKWNDTFDENDGILADEWNEDDSNLEYEDSDDEESGFGEI